jgi:hypothetical protein
VTSSCHVTLTFQDFDTSGFGIFHTHILDNSRMSNFRTVVPQSFGLRGLGLQKNFSSAHFKTLDRRASELSIRSTSLQVTSSCRITLTLQDFRTSEFHTRAHQNTSNVELLNRCSLSFGTSELRDFGTSASEDFTVEHHPTPELSDIEIPNTC